MELTKDFRNVAGDRVRCTLRLESRSGKGRETDTHTAAPWRFVRVSIVGEAAPKGVRFGTNASGYGQVWEHLSGSPAAHVVRRLWARWHLNDMRAGCFHQGGPREVGEVCPFSGYRFGHAWLVEPLTAEGALDLLRAFGAGDDVTVLSRDGLAVEVLPSYVDAFGRLLEVQGQSVAHATAHEGWALDRVQRVAVSA